MTEAFLQYIWQYRLLEEPLFTTEGIPIQILRSGLANCDAGPDFFDARVSIGGTLWVGNVEVHILSSDWNRHHHSSDAAYNNVVLHVVYEHDCDIVSQSGLAMPTLELKRYIPAVVWSNYEALVDPPDSVAIPCADRLGVVPQMAMNATLDALLLERMQQKTSDVKSLLKSAKGSWDNTFYWLLARFFGGKVNAFPFELLAKSTDLKMLSRWRDNVERIEALLYGQAGMLDGYFDDDYPRRLQADYEALRFGSQLTPISGTLWKFFRLRPSAFPTLRISQFAHLFVAGENMFSKLLEVDDATILESFFNREASPYWNNHYRFDHESSFSVKSSGKMFADLLIVNVIAPLLFEYGVQHSDEKYKQRAIDLLRQLPPEDNNIIRKWLDVGVKPSDAAASQSLIQLHNLYCKPRQCLKCRLGYYVLNDKSMPYESF